MATIRRRMGGVLTRSIRSSKKTVTTKPNIHLSKHTTSARRNFNTITADSAAISIYNKRINNNKNFHLYLSKNLKSKLSNSTFSYSSQQKAYASSLLKDLSIKPLSEGYSSDEETVNWSEAVNIFDMNMEFIYDLIPPDILNEVTSNDTPDWYINFMNSEPSIANIPQPLPSEDQTPTEEIEQADESTTSNAHPIENSTSVTISSPSNQTNESSLQYMSYKTLSTPSTAILPTYYQPNTNIQKFHKEFPIPNRLYRKWKDGIPLWSTKKYAKKFKDINTDQKTIVIQRLLESKIIVKSGRCAFCSDFFLLESKGKIRPIFNYIYLKLYYLISY